MDIGSFIRIFVHMGWILCFIRIVESTCCSSFTLSNISGGLEYRCDIKIRSSEYWNRNNHWKINLRFNTSIIASVGKSWSKGSAQCMEDAATPLSYICTGEWSPEFTYSFMLIKNNLAGSAVNSDIYYLQTDAYEESCENRLEGLCPNYPAPQPAEEQKPSENVHIPGTGVSVNKTILIVCVCVGSGCLAITVLVVVISQRRKNARSTLNLDWDNGPLGKPQLVEPVTSSDDIS
jgi:hypothetical protein